MTPTIATSGRFESGFEDGAPRQWRTFMLARVFVAFVLLVVFASLSVLGQWINVWVLGTCIAYFCATVVVSTQATPRAAMSQWSWQWLWSVGIDLAVFSILLFLQSGGINYTPLFALPVLLAAVLGSLLLALGTAAAVTLIILTEAWFMVGLGGADVTTRFLQAGLTGSGLFVVALLANQLSSRLARQEHLASSNASAARMQTQVNQLVIETLADGILVCDGNGVVRAANPAARTLLGDTEAARLAPFVLAGESAWQPLVHLATLTFSHGAGQVADVSLSYAQSGQRRLRVTTRLTAHSADDDDQEKLCVFFLEDLREMEARLRTEKLAAMGRMSAAVAHEIRNPLAAISQANALLAEDLVLPAQRQLTTLVQQNALRLARIVDDVLDVSRAQPEMRQKQMLFNSEQTIEQICRDWAVQNHAGERFVAFIASNDNITLLFEEDHIRRVLVNLLDNALRYASQAKAAIKVAVTTPSAQQVRLSVWSDGSPLELGVQRHLFEPFFSSESRSSGLGLFICRELCERHGALIGYQRLEFDGHEGNEFFVLLRKVASAAAKQMPALEAK